MNTPIYDFVKQYALTDMARFHMPGHKGQERLGCERWDITEVHGADALYEADGIIAQSEANATVLFGSKRTLYSTEGSSLCIRAMLYLALTNRKDGASPVIVAARNVHKTFVYAAALLDAEVVWIWPEDHISLCGCPISPGQLEQTLKQLETPPAAVYITSPDYLGGMADISALAEVCHRYETLLLVDNAHGAYLRFLRPSRHPLDLGADICCDSAHKTLPVLTGGAYLHISKRLSDEFAVNAKSAMALFGSTSPSYLILSSLDACNLTLSGDYCDQLQEFVDKMNTLKGKLSEEKWRIEVSDPLRLTICVPEGLTGTELAQKLRNHGMECEYSDDQFLVLMLTTDNTAAELTQFLQIMGKNSAAEKAAVRLPKAYGEQVISIREALFSPHEIVDANSAYGRVCGAPMVSCPPAIPIVVSGERIGREALELFHYYGVKKVDVLK